jgi:hypothetical protein
MACIPCKSYYCSACCPQVRSDDAFWEDVVCSLGGAFRDIERVKAQLAREISADFERIRSALNCQEVGSETLSAEQIVVEHAVEQVKSLGVFASCQAPDGPELEEVVVASSVSGPQASEHVLEKADPQLSEPTIAKCPIEDCANLTQDLLDLTVPAVSEAAAKQESTPRESPAALEVDLLDLSDSKQPGHVQNCQEDAIPAPELVPPPQEPRTLEDMSLLDLSDNAQVCYEENGAQTTEAMPDLLDFAEPLPVHKEVIDSRNRPEPSANIAQHSE